MECSCFIGDLEERKLSKLLSALNRVLNSIADLREKRKEINQNYEEQIVEYFRVGLPQEALPRADILIQMESTNKAIDLIHCFCERLVMRLLNHREFPYNLRIEIESLSYAASICWEMIPELKNLKKMFEDRFGKDFVVADNVHKEMISWLSNEPTHGEQLERAQKIAKKHKIDLNYSADIFVSGHHPDSESQFEDAANIMYPLPASPAPHIHPNLPDCDNVWSSFNEHKDYIGRHQC